MTWQDEAACHNSFDHRAMSPNLDDQLGFAADYCRQCPVRPDCFHHWHTHRDTIPVGVWGGIPTSRLDGGRERSREVGWQQTRVGLPTLRFGLKGERLDDDRNA